MAVPFSLQDMVSRFTGQPTQLPGATMAAPSATETVARPTMDQLQAQDYQYAAMNRLGQLGMLLMAAGQRLTPAQRATILGQAPQAMSGIQSDVAQAAQARLMASRAQQEQAETERAQALRQRFADPQFLNSLGIKPEVAEALGPAGIQKLIENQALANTPEAQLDRRYKEAQIDHLLNPVRTSPTPQMVDLPGGGKGWATPGSTDVIPIGGAGKGGVDPEMAKRTEGEDKNLTYAKEAIVANRYLSDPSIAGDLTSGYKSRVNKIPTLEGSWAGEKYLTGDSQANSFVDSVVRPRSGAVVGPAEMADKKRIFTPMPGDSQQRLFEKAQQRAEHIKSLIAGANPADRPMLQKMFDESQQEILATISGGQGSAPNNQGTQLPSGVTSIRRVR